jgi:hypothetical protein
MADDVEVKFGATIGDLVAAVDKAKGQVSSFGTAVANTAKLSAGQMQNLSYQIHDIATGLLTGQSPFMIMAQQGSQITQVFGEGTGVRGMLRALGSSIVTFISNPLTLAVLGFGLAAQAAESLFQVVIRGGNAAAETLARNRELTADLNKQFTDTGKAAEALFVTSLAQRRLELQKQIDDTAKLVSDGLRRALLPLSSLEGDPRSGLGQFLEKFMADINAGTADVGKFNNELADLFDRAAKVDPHPERIRAFWKEIQAVIEPANTANKSLTDLKASLHILEGTASDVEKAFKGVKDEVNGAAASFVSLDEKAAAARAILTGNRFDFVVGLPDPKIAADRALAIKKAADLAAEAGRRAAVQAALEAKAVQDAWVGTWSKIMSAGDAAVTGLLTHTMTWKQAMFSVLGSVWQQFALTVEQMIVKWLAMESAKTMATILGEETRAGAAEAGAAKGLAMELMAAIASIKIAAEKTFANVFGFFSPFLGPLAAIPAAAAAGVVGAAAAALPSFAVGAWELPSDMVARVHKGEMIVPAAQAEQMRQGGGMSGGDIDRLVAKLVPHLKAVANASRATQRHIDNRLRTLRGVT